MMDQPNKIFLINDRKASSSLLIWLVLGFIFILSSHVMLNYGGNQVTKFVHGLASAGYGYLNEDWFANTTAPLPVFRELVRLTYLYLSENAFYLYYLLLGAVYIFSIYGIVTQFYDIHSSLVRFSLFFVLMLATFGVIFDPIFEPLGFRLKEIFHYGMGNHFTLGDGLEPASFGAFVFLSFYLFLRRRPYWAIISLCTAALFHSAYYFTAAMVTAAYMWVEFRERRDWSRAVKIGSLSLALVLPFLIYSKFFLGSTSPEMWREAMELIVNQRIANLTHIGQWFSFQEAFQTLMVVLVMFMVRRSRLFWALCLPFAAALLLSLYTVFVPDLVLQFLMPWRVMVVLAPATSGLLFGWAVSRLVDWQKDWFDKNQPGILGALAVVAAASMVMGVRDIQQSLALRNDPREKALEQYVAENKAPGEVYLIPPRERRLEGFRLTTGAPIFVNRKSHPYLDFEVIEWDQRMALADKVYQGDEAGACQAVDAILAEYTITHVVVGKQAKYFADCVNLSEIYSDQLYRIFEVHD